MTVRIINADVMDGLRQLADESVQCVVTSPPYWGLRDYGVDGQIGQEATPAEFVARMVDVFREVRRVLRKDGTLWVNMGDSYCSTDKWGGGKSGNTGKQTVAADGVVPSLAVRDKKQPIEGIKPKDLMGMPWRLAFALQADGWWLRSDIIWSKPNPMPESVTDRPTKAHEYIFLLTKSERYFYDAEAIKEFATYPDGPNAPDKIVSPYGQGMSRDNIGAKGNANGFRGGSYVGGKPGPRTQAGNTKPDKQRGHGRRHAGFNDRWDDMPKAEQRGSRNKRSVWTIATAPFPEAHFATFPPEIPEICIKAGCPKGGTVLDPFSGAGTTALVADRLQRNAIGIELNPEYAAMSEARINRDRGGLLDAMEVA
jgi:DNA modification methylase